MKQIRKRSILGFKQQKSTESGQPESQDEHEARIRGSKEAHDGNSTAKTALNSNFSLRVRRCLPSSRISGISDGRTLPQNLRMEVVWYEWICGLSSWRTIEREFRRLRDLSNEFTSSRLCLLAIWKTKYVQRLYGSARGTFEKSVSKVDGSVG
jgi:hypothetical protein